MRISWFTFLDYAFFEGYYLIVSIFRIFNSYNFSFILISLPCFFYLITWNLLKFFIFVEEVIVKRNYKYMQYSINKIKIFLY